MSGPHTAAVAAARPDLVRKLVLVDLHWPLDPESPTDYDLDGWRTGVAAENNSSLEQLLAIGRRDNPTRTEEDLEPWAPRETDRGPRGHHLAALQPGHQPLAWDRPTGSMLHLARDRRRRGRRQRHRQT